MGFNLKNFHGFMLYAVVLIAVAALLSLPVLTAAGAPTALSADEVSQAAEAAILVQSAQIQAMQAQARLQEANERYKQVVAELQAKHGAAGCNLTARQTWSCPPKKEDANANQRTTGRDGSGTGTN